MAHTYSKTFFQSLPGGRKAELWTITIDAGETWPAPPPGQPAGIAVPYSSFLDAVTGLPTEIASIDFPIITTPVIGFTDKGFMPWVKPVNVLGDPDEFAQTEPYLIVNLFCWNSGDGEVFCRGTTLPAECDGLKIEILVFEGDDTAGWADGPVLTGAVTGTVAGDQWPLGWEVGSAIPIFYSGIFLLGTRADTLNKTIEHRPFGWGNPTYGESPGTSQLASYPVRLEGLRAYDSTSNDLLAGATVRPFEPATFEADWVVPAILGGVLAVNWAAVTWTSEPAADTVINPVPQVFLGSWDDPAKAGTKTISAVWYDDIANYPLFTTWQMEVAPPLGTALAAATYQAQPAGDPMPVTSILEYDAACSDASPTHPCTLELWATKDVDPAAKVAEVTGVEDQQMHRIPWQILEVGTYGDVFIQIRDAYVDANDDISGSIAIPIFNTFTVV